MARTTKRPSRLEPDGFVVDAAGQTAAPLVSVVLPTHLSPPPYLKEAVASVVDQTWTRWELVVVDDGSPDPDGVAKVLGDVDPRVRIVRTVRGGPAQARNLGAAHATGDLITFLDHDDVWYPEHLSKSVAALVGDAAAVAAFAAMEIVSADRAHGRTVEGREVDRHTVLSGGDRPSLNALVIRRVWFDEVDGFDTRYECGEDVDLIFKLVEHGHFAYVDEVAAIYRIHDENWSGDTRRTGVSVDRMMGDHLRRARRSGDTEARRDLRGSKRHGRRFYAEVAVGKAVATWRAKQHWSAVVLMWWAMRFSPVGAMRGAGKLVARRWPGKGAA
jgi:glycosyltransferase involved in cell wall biosynthesis